MFFKMPGEGFLADMNPLGEAEFNGTMFFTIVDISALRFVEELQKFSADSLLHSSGKM